MNKYKKEARRVQKIRFIIRSCKDKVRYNSKELALATPYKQDVYQCKFCNGWHLTGKISKTLGLIRSKGRAIIV